MILSALDLFLASRAPDRHGGCLVIALDPITPDRDEIWPG